MNLKKWTAIGIIALFFGLMVVPVNGVTVEKTERKIPIELSMVNADGSIGSQIISLTQQQVEELSDLIDSIRNDYNRNSILDKIKDFFKRNNYPRLDNLLDMAFLDLLPGTPVFSIGEGRELLTKYHGRIQAKKLVSAWHYPEWGFTMIWRTHTAMPNQILLKRQMGLMVGFVGLYLYIPPLIDYMPSKTCFVGSALFAWGISL